MGQGHYATDAGGADTIFVSPFPSSGAAGVTVGLSTLTGKTLLAFDLKTGDIGTSGEFTGLAE